MSVRREESGAALILALLVTLLAVSLGFAVLAMTGTQLRLAANQRDGNAALDAAEAGASLTLDRLARGAAPPAGNMSLAAGDYYQVTVRTLARQGKATTYQIDADGYAGKAHRRVTVRVAVQQGGGAATVLSWREDY